MALAERLTPSGPRANRLSLILDGINGADRDALIAAILDADFSHANIGDALRSEGYDITNAAVGAFRRDRKKMEALRESR